MRFSVLLNKFLQARFPKHVEQAEKELNDFVESLRYKPTPLEQVETAVLKHRKTAACYLSRNDYRALCWALEQAKQWRGSLTDDTDPEGLQQFDNATTRSRDALNKILHALKQEKL